MRSKKTVDKLQTVEGRKKGPLEYHLPRTAAYIAEAEAFCGRQREALASLCAVEPPAQPKPARSAADTFPTR